MTVTKSSNPFQKIPGNNPWDNPAPKSKRHTALTPEQKQSAKARAAKAGRPYPNLVDNMWVTKKTKQDQMRET